MYAFRLTIGKMIEMSFLDNYKRVVIKIGSSTLTHAETGSLNFSKMERLVRSICDYRNSGMDVCLVSSGAIAVGRDVIGIKERPSDISIKQACAAVGQGRLMMTYQKLFSEYNQNSGQVLMTKNTIVNPVSRRNVMNTFEELFDLNVVPIVNENDTVSTYEMQFGDNDTLSAIVTSITKADLLILLSDIDGLYSMILMTIRMQSLSERLIRLTGKYLAWQSHQPVAMSEPAAWRQSLQRQRLPHIPVPI